MTVSTEPLAALDVGSRLGRLRDRLAAASIDALLVTKLANVRYLTGRGRPGRAIPRCVSGRAGARRAARTGPAI